MTRIACEHELPASHELEVAVLGQALSSEKIYAQMSSLTPDDFSDPHHRDVWTMMGDLVARGAVPDPVMLKAEAEARGLSPGIINPIIGGYPSNVVAITSAPGYVAHLKDLAKRRRALEALYAMGDTLADTRVAGVAEDQIGRTVADLVGIAGEGRDLIGLDELGDAYLAGEHGFVTPTGFPILDDALAGGFHQHRVYGFSGKMKAGKTAFLTSISYQMVERGEPHAYLCLEQRALEMGHRYYARHMRANALAFLDPMDRETPWFRSRLHAAREYFARQNAVKFIPRPRMTLDDLRAQIASLALSGKYRGVFVDYLQLVQGKRNGENETNHLDNVAQTLAELAAGYPIWIAVGAQQNDEGGVRGGKGLAAACDVLFGLDDSDPEDSRCVDAHGQERVRRHLTMQFSRYTPPRDIGKPDHPGYELRSDIGPYFEELP
jgi:replicative DNA helicase